MPESGTLTGYKRRIRTYADENGHEISDSKISRLALKWWKRKQAISEDLLRRLFDHADPTATQAIQNIETEKRLRNHSPKLSEAA
jgi:hypothetical protein